MESTYAKEFIDYLYYIGILSEDGIKQFITHYNQATEQFTGKSNEQTAVLLKTLGNYLSSLTKLEIKSCSKNIVYKFEENHKKIKTKYLQEVIHSALSRTVSRYFIRWKHQTHLKPYQSQSIRAMYQSPKLNKSSHENFINRQEQFIQQRKAKTKKLSSKTEEDLLVQCTFSPKVFSTKDQMSPHVRNKKLVERLFADSNRRNDIFNKKQSNSKSKGNSVAGGTICSNKAINKLYRDAKEREVSKKTLQQQIDEERGMTFKPASFTKDCGYEVSTQFHERNKKLIDDRHNFVFVYDYLRESKFNDNALFKKNQILQKAIEVNEKAWAQE